MGPQEPIFIFFEIIGTKRKLINYFKILLFFFVFAPSPSSLNLEGKKTLI